MQLQRSKRLEPFKLADYSYLRLKSRPRLPTTRNKVRIVDLYCGAGSLSLGIWEACRELGVGFESAAAIDINPSALDVYVANFPQARTILADSRTLIDGKIGERVTKNERALMDAIGKFGWLNSGSPCQGFSPLNNRSRGRDERNSLYLRGTRLVEVAMPENILFENVPDVLNGDIDVVGITRDTLGKLAYHMDSRIVDLSILGVPQVRRRHLLVASMSKKVSIERMIDERRVTHPRSVWWAIWDLEGKETRDIYGSPSKLSLENQHRVDYLQRTGAFDLPNRLRPPCHRGVHRYKSMYGRLNYGGPSQTITSGFSSPGQGRFIHPTKRRTLTPHEAARLQFFPDFFDFSAVRSRAALAEMIGNAVPSKLSSVIGLNLLAN